MSTKSVLTSSSATNATGLADLLRRRLRATRPCETTLYPAGWENTLLTEKEINAHLTPSNPVLAVRCEGYPRGKTSALDGLKHARITAGASTDCVGTLWWCAKDIHGLQGFGSNR